MIKRIFIIFVLIGGIAYGNMGIFPGILELEIEEGSAQGTFTVFNQSQEMKRYSGEIREIDNQKNKSLLSEYMTIFPSKFTLEPGKSQKVRVAIREFKGMNEGEYRSSLKVREIKSNLSKNHESKAINDGVGAKVTFNITTIMAVYAQVGNKETDISLEVDKKNKNVEVKNEGNHSVALKYKIIRNNEEVEEVYIGKLIEGYSLELPLDKVNKGDLIKIYSLKSISKESGTREVKEDKILFRGVLF